MVGSAIRAVHRIAVTGSVGKTGTKEMLAVAFSAIGQTHASKASYNNHWGVPLSLARMHAGADYGVFEVGMNHANEITPLSQQIKPDIAIITTVAAVHIENFESVEAIADAKAEIFDGMAAGGYALLNNDNEWFLHLREKAEARGLDVKSFGDSAVADAHLVDCLEAANGTRVTARILGEMVSFTLHVPGRHIALNALAVLLALKLAGGDIQIASKALSKMEAIAGRGKREYLNIGDPNNPVTLIDDSYNASPVAMNAAFKVLALIDPALAQQVTVEVTDGG
jgi:UDP-N-acetylmuramoyl-tripeptide--D-alanyl-D-alanine ligase